MPTHPIDTHVGNRLRLRRSAIGMSQESLSKDFGITFQQVQKYEKGINRISSSRLYDFAKKLGVEVGYFFEGVEGSGVGFAEDQDDLQGLNMKHISTKETLSLVRHFSRINDPDVRKKVLLLIKSISEAH